MGDSQDLSAAFGSQSEEEDALLEEVLEGNPRGVIAAQPIISQTKQEDTSDTCREEEEEEEEKKEVLGSEEEGSFADARAWTLEDSMREARHRSPQP